MESSKLQNDFSVGKYGGTERLDKPTTDSIDTAATDELTLDELRSLTETPARQMSAVIDQTFGGIEGLCSRLSTSSDIGLKSEDLSELERRREKFGSNRIPPRKKKPFIYFVWEAVQDTTLIILIIAAIISLGLSFYTPPPQPSTGAPSDPTDSNAGFIEGIGIIVAVVIIVLVTAGINYNKEAQFRGLQRRLADEYQCTVVRSKTVSQMPASELVVGDLCLFEYGDAVPADGILVRGFDLRLDESSHTGESKGILKDVNSNPVLYSGTHVIEGSGKMLVIGVGLNSAKGAMYSLLGAAESKETDDEPEEKKSPLHKKLSKLATQIAYAGTTLALLTFVILVIRFCVETFVMQGKPWSNVYIQDFVGFIIISITILVVAVPEGLPLAVILALAYSIKKMVNDNNLVRHLDACEVMGHATTILCDKTGTLTTNRMTVVNSYVAGFVHDVDATMKHLPQSVRLLICTLISVNTSYKTQLMGSGKSSVQTGNRTECALLAFAFDLGYDYRYLREKFPEKTFTKVFPFSSAKKWMATVLPTKSADADGQRVFVKGAWEVVLKRCRWILSSDFQPEELTEEGRTRLRQDVVEPMSTRGLRVVVLAYKDFHLNPDADYVEKMTKEMTWNDEELIFSQLICLSIAGIEDPVRPEVPDAVSRCQKAGITVRMVTGDHLDTARYVAIRCGILNPGEPQLSIDGCEFNRLTRKSPQDAPDQEAIDQLWPKLRVLARSSPIDKCHLVRGIMSSVVGAHRQIVAVTGDGTNDGPALRKAHVGLAMGVTGTDVAKEASDIILIDDNFSSIVKAVVWGRHVYDSIAKFVQFQLTVNVVAVALTLIGACVVMDSPLKGVQMLWVNLLMDSLASLSLATEAPTEDVLKRKPYGSKQHLVSCLMAVNIIAHSVYELTALLVILFAGADLLDIDDGRDPTLRGIPNGHYTFLFNAFVMMILFNEINARKIDADPNVFGGLRRSPTFVLIWLASFIVQVIIVEVGGNVFLTVKLTWDQWLWSIFIGMGDLIYGQMVTFAVKCYKIFAKRRRSHSKERGESQSDSSDSETTEYEMSSSSDSRPLCAEAR